MKRSVLVLSEKGEDTEQIKNAYDSDDSFTADTVFQAEKALEILLQKPIDLLVFNIKEFSNQKLQSVLDLRMIGAEFPVLTLASEASEEAFQNVGKVKDAIILTKPYESQQLLDISRYLAEGDTLIQRLFQRFKTTEKALIQNIADEIATEADLVNISKSGALFSLANDANFKKGKAILMQMNLSNVGKQHRMYGEVRWIKESQEDGKLYLGVMFISQDKALDKHSKSS